MFDQDPGSWLRNMSQLKRSCEEGKFVTMLITLVNCSLPIVHGGPTFMKSRWVETYNGCWHASLFGGWPSLLQIDQNQVSLGNALCWLFLRSCYLNRWFCKFVYISVSTIDLLGPGHTIMLYTHGKCFRVIWAIWRHAVPFWAILGILRHSRPFWCCFGPF